MEPAKEKKKDNTALYVVYAAAAYFGLQFLLKPKRSQSAILVTNPAADPVTQAVLQPVPDTTPIATTKGTWLAESFPIRKGMKGTKIKALQLKLGVTADGAFGNNTEAALLNRYGVSSVSQDLYKSIVGPPAKTSAGTNPIPKSTVWTAESFPLRKGMKGANIKTLQQKLGISADGAFGDQTEKAVMTRFGTPSVTEVQFKSLKEPVMASINSLLVTIMPKQSASRDNSIVLKNGSRGTDVYRLQKWLGFKDRQSAKKGEPIADSIFGTKTLTALQRKTGKLSITVSELNARIGRLSGYLGEILVTKKNTTVLNGNLYPHRKVLGNTILGTRTMELTDPQAQKAYTQFRTVDGLHRWVETDAV